MKENWKEKVVLVTGGSSGLGRMIAEGFGRRGAKLAIAALEEELLVRSTQEMTELGFEVHPILANITQQSDVDRMYREIISRYGHLDVLVNNAGRTHRGKIASVTPEEVQSLFDLNVLGTIRCTQRMLSLLLETRGHVVNIGSLAAKSASRWVGAYPMSKFAVAAFSQQLRLELGSSGLHVLLVCPGPIKRDDPRLYQLPDSSGIPESALRPGGGVHLKGINPEKLTEQIIRYCELRRPELVMPGKARLLFAISQLFPRLGDWLVLKNTN